MTKSRFLNQKLGKRANKRQELAKLKSQFHPKARQQRRSKRSSKINPVGSR